jgi:hypothetical protein
MILKHYFQSNLDREKIIIFSVMFFFFKKKVVFGGQRRDILFIQKLNSETVGGLKTSLFVSPLDLI